MGGEGLRIRNAEHAVYDCVQEGGPRARGGQRALARTRRRYRICR